MFAMKVKLTSPEYSTAQETKTQPVDSINSVTAPPPLHDTPLRSMNEMKLRILAIALLLLTNLAMSQEEEEKAPATIMRGLRIMMLTSDPKEAGLSKEENGGDAFGIVMDMPIGGDHTASVVSFITGDASLYTTATFGVMGGVGHEPVRREAKEFVREAEGFLKMATKVEEFPYPDSETVYFYIITFDGVFRAESSMSDIENGKTSLRRLFGAGQDVLTQLRLTTQKGG